MPFLFPWLLPCKYAIYASSNNKREWYVAALSVHLKAEIEHFIKILPVYHLMATDANK